LVQALEAHSAHLGAFTVDDLLRFSAAREPAVPNRGAEPPHDHQEGPLQEAAAITLGGVGAAPSGIAAVLALSRSVEKKERNLVSSLVGV
jgi:hypothetical protein